MFTKGHPSYLTETSKKKISETCKKNGVGKWMQDRKASKETIEKMKLNSSRYWLGKKRPEMTGKNHPNWKEKPIKVKTYGKGRKRPDTAERMLKNNPTKGKFGKNHPKWVENKKSPFHKSIRQFFKYRQWRLSVFKKDNFTCVMCGKTKTYFEADHYPKRFIDIINTNNIKTFQEAENCKELWDVKNGRTLCKKCHLETITWGKQKIKYKNRSYKTSSD